MASWENLRLRPMTKRGDWRTGMRVSRLFLTVAIAILSSAFAAIAAPLPSQLGPEVALTRPRDGYVGRLDVAPLNGPAGTTVTVTADRLPPAQEFQLVWR